MSLKEKIDTKRIPKHVAIIMDGNGRWAKQRGLQRVFGHKNAIQAVRDTTEAAGELGVKYLTLYAFSTENWNRPKHEVSALMQLLVSTLRKETKRLNENNVRLFTIGQTQYLPQKCQDELQEAMSITEKNTGLQLNLALNYGAKEEILSAVKQIVQDKVDIQTITPALFSSYLYTASMDEPELMIRTSGETRLSNFLLWQLAYAEFYFTPILWPDFRKEHFFEAICAFQSRERRFGKTSEQLKNN